MNRHRSLRRKCTPLIFLVSKCPLMAIALPEEPGNLAITFAMATGPSGVRPEKESSETWAPVGFSSVTIQARNFWLAADPDGRSPKLTA